MLLGLTLVGGGCSYKYEADWNTKDRAWENQPAASTSTVASEDCAAEGQKPEMGAQCCAGLEMVAIDDAFEACGKPGTGHRPRVCAAPDEVLTVETPNCCAGLEPVEKNGKWVCDSNL